MSLRIKEYLIEKKEYFEKNIESYFPKIASEIQTLEKSMRYSLEAGGKRIRPVLTFAVAEMLGFPLESVIPAALSIEMIHTYSLIHDDLPCMDDDDFRRGKPTNHKVFGEDIAVLAGDGLLTEAFGVAANYPDSLGFLNGKLDFIAHLVKAAGANGMVGGQVMDMEHPKNGGFEYLKLLHSRKTGEMIKIACIAPLLIHCAPQSEIGLISEFGKKIGLLFQVVDDILDATATLDQLGKTPGKDAIQNKLTYVSLFGLDETKNMAEKLVDESCKLISEYKNSQYLQEITKYIYNRSN